MGSDLAATSRDGEERPDPFIGITVADRYLIERALSRGAMGRIYVAEQSPLGRKVALKILDAQSHSPDSAHTFEQRFLREAATCARLNHPNTVRVFDYGRLQVDSTSTWFMAMELIVGDTLRERLTRDGPFEAGRALSIVREVARSLREAHRLGVIHRDLKPTNIMLTQGEDGEAVKVLDFGIAKILDNPEFEDLTSTDRVIGTPRYMAPEMFRHRPVDARTDLYSLGVVLYELLAGSPPFNGDVVQIAMAHINEQPQPILKYAGISVPPEAEAIAMRCMAKNPDDRFADATAFISACSAALGDLFVRSSSPDVPLVERPYTALLTSTPPAPALSEAASWNQMRNLSRAQPPSGAFEISRAPDVTEPSMEQRAPENATPESAQKTNKSQTRRLTFAIAALAVLVVLGSGLVWSRAQRDDASTKVGATAQDGNDASTKVEATAQGENDASTKVEATAQGGNDASTKVEATAQGGNDASTKVGATAQGGNDASTKAGATAQGGNDASTKVGATAQGGNDASTKVETSAQSSSVSSANPAHPVPGAGAPSSAAGKTSHTDDLIKKGSPSSPPKKNVPNGNGSDKRSNRTGDDSKDIRLER